MLDNKKLIEKYLGYLKKVYKFYEQDFLLIQKAVSVSEIAHRGQYRDFTGTAFVAHPMRVAVMSAEKTDDLSIILAAILHDTVEDSEEICPMSCIYEEFGDEIGFLVDSVTSTLNFYHKYPEQKFQHKIDKFLFGVMQDVRCAFLKLIDREHNIKTLSGLKVDKQIRKSFETQAIYVPLRKILGLDNKNFNYSDMNKRFQIYLKTHNINSVNDLKSNLYNVTFKDIDSNNFQTFYSASKNVVRKITDRKILNTLINNGFFDSKIEIISFTETAKGKFSCLFKYKEGKVFGGKIKMSVHSFKY